MAKKKKGKSLEERVAEQVKKLYPAGLIPESYINYVVMENADIAESEEELLANVKMQLYEESGVDVPLTRKETEEYLLDTLEDEQWNSISQDGQMLASQVKMMDESCDKTMLDMIKDLPLIPASRIVSSIVIDYLRHHGQEITDERAEEITEDLIHTLNTSFGEMVMEDMDIDLDIEMDPDWEDKMGIEFDWGDDELPFPDDGDAGPKKGPQSGNGKRKSRITRFPGKD